MVLLSFQYFLLVFLSFVNSSDSLSLICSNQSQTFNDTNINSIEVKTCEVENFSPNLYPIKSIGPDKIHTCFLHGCTKTFAERTFSQICKSVYINYTQKGLKTEEEVSKYRPIFKLRVVSKVLELMTNCTPHLRIVLIPLSMVLYKGEYNQPILLY